MIMATKTAAASKIDWALSKFPKSNLGIAQDLKSNIFPGGASLFPKKNWFLKFKLRCDEENEQFIEEREDFEKRVLGFSENSVMGDFELVNLMEEMGRRWWIGREVHYNHDFFFFWKGIKVENVLANGRRVDDIERGNG